MRTALLKTALISCLLPILATLSSPQTEQPAPAPAPVPHKSADSSHAAPRHATPPSTKLTSKLTEEQRALHALNRLTFGPRPGDLQKVMNMDVDDWIEQQLHPEEINDSVLDGKLGPLRTLRMSTRDLVQSFPNNKMIREAADGKIPLPTDPLKRSIYEVHISILAERQKREQAAAGGKASDDANPKSDQRDQETVATRADHILELPKDKRMEAILALPTEERRRLVTHLRGQQRDRLLADLPPEQRETFLAMSPNGPVNVVIAELQQAKLLRALYSERQLQEVMTDFWFNHFNIYARKDADQYLVTAYERDVIRPHALGKFKDLLLATAQSPAMLVYLDNWLSEGPKSLAAVAAANKGKQAVPGLNENYGRELMELHTLSVNGGYTQHDVTELARVLTGWTIQPIEQGAMFQFDPRKHDPGDKVVLGQTISENGANEGLQVIDMLAHHPNTAKFIARKLAIRFVADDPPPALVDRLAQKFLSTDGDIREVLRTLFKSPEFWSAKTYRAKVKTPFEFVVSSLRATGTDLNNPGPLLGILNKMGMPLYEDVPPTGYSMTASTWMNSDALIDRVNYAIALSNGQVGGTNFDAGRLLALGTLTSRGFPHTNPSCVGGADLALSGAKGPGHNGAEPRHHTAAANTAVDCDSDADRGEETALLLLENALLNGEVSPATQKAIRLQLDDPQVAAHALDDPKRTLNTMTALVIGSPDFQRR
jgi:uncharacterized protein (DUF1800 family)